MQTLKSLNDLKRHIEPLRPDLDAALRRVLDSGWFVLGPEVHAFEEEYARYCGVAECVTVANGTDALELALRALAIGAGCRVATVTNAGMYSTTAILAAGATPVFIDVDSTSLLMDSQRLAKVLAGGEAIHAVIVTHLYGMLADVEALHELTRAHGIPLIEDCAQAHGARLGASLAGSFGEIGCFSFYPTKNLGALGDGGAIVTRNQDLAKRVRQLRQYGWTTKYQSSLPGGRNSRLDEMQAAILRLKLRRLDGWNDRRRQIAARYSSEISNPRVQCPTVHGEQYVAHLYVIRSEDRDGLRSHLAQVSVPSDVHYPVPDNLQVSLGGYGLVAETPIADAACRRVLSLPCFPEMTDDEVACVIAAVNAW